jgi:multidrug efflux pump
VTLYKLSIERPVLATVMSIVIMIFGWVSYQRLGVREFPAVDPPIITVSTAYPGAAPEVIESQITEPLEEAINAVAGVRTLTSSSREGRSTIIVEFRLGRDMETAANDVRDKVSAAQRNLPPDADPPITSKADADSQPVVFIAVYSPERDLLELSDIAYRQLRPFLQTIDGVAEVGTWGEKRYSMRLWLDGHRLAAHGLTPLDVRNALDRENVELPSGRLDGAQVELNVRLASRFTRPEEFNNLVLRETTNGIVRLKDVGDAVISPENQRSLMKQNGVPGVGVVLRPQPGANQIAIADELYKRLELIRKDLPQDIQTTVSFDITRYVRASIREVRETIFLAITLVVLIIFLFLRTWRSTIVPALAIPVSLIGGFFVMYVAGFSINVLTLLAMVLAIGIVVDDAIVVLENIYTKIENGLPAREAGVQGTREVFFAVIATTTALVAVFAPILFLGGLIGHLFREFAVVLAGTVAISAFVALTLTPMLATKVLQAHSHSRFYEWTEPFFRGMTNGYRLLLAWFLRHRWLAFLILALTGFGAWLSFSHLQRELAPLEDRGRLRLVATAPEGTSYDFMVNYMDRLSELVSKSVSEATVLITYTAPGGGAVNSGFVRTFLVDRAQRRRSQGEIAAELNRASRQLNDARVSVMQDPTISLGQGAGSRQPVQFVIQAPNFEKLRTVLGDFMNRAEAHEAFSRVDVDLKFNKPQLHIEIDRDRAQALGVSAHDIGETLNLALAEQRFGYFLREGRQYYVIGALVREQRDDNLDLRSIFVPGRDGQPVRLDNVVKFKEEVSPPQLFRFNRYSSATVSAGLNPGYTLGQGVEAMESIARDVLDDTFRTDLAGEARDLRETGSGTIFAFFFALVLIYFVLSAQFESFLDPLAILLTVPLSLVGTLGFLWFTGQTLNIFSQIGIIMLIGLVTKNGILVVEFANQQRDRGLPPLDAALEAAVSRLRPVLMTSLSTILGILPIALALGAGAESRRSMGIAVVGGLIIGTALTLLVIPAMYTFLTRKNRVPRSRE